MLRFNLKMLFCLVLIVGVALMWIPWARGTDETANRLLTAREKSKIINRKMRYDDVLNFLDIQEDTFSGGGLRVVETNADGETYECPGSGPILWMGCSFNLYYFSDGHVETVSWEADWPAIEQHAREENGILYRNVIVTVLASLVFGWVMFGCRLVIGKVR